MPDYILLMHDDVPAGRRRPGEAWPPTSPSFVRHGPSRAEARLAAGYVCPRKALPQTSLPRSVGTSAFVQRTWTMHRGWWRGIRSTRRAAPSRSGSFRKMCSSSGPFSRIEHLIGILALAAVALATSCGGGGSSVTDCPSYAVCAQYCATEFPVCQLASATTVKCQKGCA